jgi:NADPH:quinone reductase-like Zn-dependent oxidoreductase
MAQVRAVGFGKPGGPEVLEVVQIPERHAGPGEMRIRVRAADINPSDVATRQGAVPRALGGEAPYVLGWDAAGVLDEIGEGVQTDLRVGDHVVGIVFPYGPDPGGYTESLVVPAESVVRAPAGTDHAAASTLPMNGLTARRALDLLALEPGAVLAVTGAAGQLGGFVVQLAKAEGLRVIGDAAPHDRDLVRDLGADVVVDRGDDVAARVRKVEPDGVDAVVDCAVQNELVVPAVRDGGQIATVRGYTAEPERGIVYHPVMVTDYVRDHAKLDELRRRVEDGTLTLRVAATYKPEKAAEAHRRFEAGGVRGRLVIEF